MKSLRGILVVVLLLAFAPFVMAQPDEKTEEMMQEVSQKAANVESCRVDIKIQSPMMGQMVVTDGKMAFKKPKMMHMKTSSNMMGVQMEQETFTKGDIVWSYMPTMKMATKLDLGMAASNMPKDGVGMGSDVTQPFKGMPREKTKYVETKTVDGVNVHVFETTPSIPAQMPQGDQRPQLMPSKIIMMVSAETGLPYKMQMLGPGDSLMMEQTYSNYRINVDIDDSEFEFTPPDDVQVVDMTQGAMNMMQKMQGETPPSE